MAKLSNKSIRSLLQSLHIDREAGKTNNILAIRMVVAAIFFAVAVLVKMPTVVRIVLLAVSLIISGFDLLIDAVNSVERKDFFATSLILISSAVIAFVIGYAAEGAALVLVYQVGLIALSFVDRKTRKTASDMLDDCDEDISASLKEIIKEKEPCELRLSDTILHNGGRILKYTMVLALVYAFVLPFLGDYNYRVSIHRALMILLVCTPASLIAAMPLTALIAICFAGQQGIVFRKASAMEDAASTNVAVFDKTGVFSEGEPHILSIQSNLIDQRTFMNFAAHAVYYSEQPFARAISAAYNSDYKLDVISDFKEIPGSGVELNVAGNPVVLASGTYFTEKGVRIPQDRPENGAAYYMTVAGRYVGQIVVSDSLNDGARQLADDMHELGIQRCVLFTEDENAESERFGDMLNFHEVYGECDTEKKLQLLSEMAQNTQNHTMYVYANGFEAHSGADVDVRISKKGKYADALIPADKLDRLPFAIQICRRMYEIATENAVLAFAVKAILIFLSMIGYSSLWFVVFMDFAAAIATQLHASRVTSDSLINTIKNRR